MLKLSRYEIGQLCSLAAMPISTGILLIIGDQSKIDIFLIVMVCLTSYLVLVKIADNKIVQESSKE